MMNCSRSKEKEKEVAIYTTQSFVKKQLSLQQDQGAIEYAIFVYLQSAMSVHSK